MPTNLGFLISREESIHYTPEDMLTRFPKDSLFEERALLLSKIHQHDQALDIYVWKLDDVATARKYCETHYDQEAEVRLVVRPPIVTTLHLPSELHWVRESMPFRSIFTVNWWKLTEAEP